MVRCLYHTNGSAVKSLYSRDAVKYGRGGRAGVAPVCYRTKSGSAAMRVPPKISTTRTGWQCTSIYDLYNNRVCFSPVPIVVPKPKPTACISPKVMADAIQRFKEVNPDAGARISKWSADFFCQIGNIVSGGGTQGVGEIIDAVIGTPCETAALSQFIELYANLGDNIKANNKKDTPADPNINAVAGFVDKVLVVASWPGVEKSAEAISDDAFKFAEDTMKVGGGFETQMFILGVGDIIAGCYPPAEEAPQILIDETVVVDEGAPAPIPTTTNAYMPETTPGPVIQTPPLVQQPTYITEQAPDDHLDKKTLLIGGIVAAVVVGGVAVVAMTRKK